mmetsp:Transcript_28206/g.56518  ORF Transcript_28206/g.56518 Transcript_28206/m.56518 type:complete len:223 (+) Transcript_28206:2005-2673(+)
MPFSMSSSSSSPPPSGAPRSAHGISISSFLRRSSSDAKRSAASSPSSPGAGAAVPSQKATCAPKLSADRKSSLPHRKQRKRSLSSAGRGGSAGAPSGPTRVPSSRPAPSPPSVFLSSASRIPLSTSSASSSSPSHFTCFVRRRIVSRYISCTGYVRPVMCTSGTKSGTRTPAASRAPRPQYSRRAIPSIVALMSTILSSGRFAGLSLSSPYTRSRSAVMRNS